MKSQVTLASQDDLQFYFYLHSLAVSIYLFSHYYLLDPLPPSRFMHIESMGDESFGAPLTVTYGLFFLFIFFCL